MNLSYQHIRYNVAACDILRIFVCYYTIVTCPRKDATHTCSLAVLPLLGYGYV